jgi:hypothetical protein
MITDTIVLFRAYDVMATNEYPEMQLIHALPGEGAACERLRQAGMLFNGPKEYGITERGKAVCRRLAGYLYTQAASLPSDVQDCKAPKPTKKRRTTR